MGRLVLSAKGFSWFRKGHPWIYRDDLEKIEDAAPGSLVDLEKKEGAFLARGFYSDRSKIAFRLVTRSRGKIDRLFWKERIENAVRFRERVVKATNAYRLIYGECDGIPSLVADRYAGHLVLQALSPGAEALIPEVAGIFLELLRPSSIVLRNDAAVRDLEGLPREKKVLEGELPEGIEVVEGSIRYFVDPWRGQKTGAYLDQRENRIHVSRWLRGKVLDGFCYEGGFALHAARLAARITGVDASQEAVERARENARLNGFANLEFRKGNVFDLLKAEAAAGVRYDGILLDPPAFAKSRENVSGAARGYKELNLRALRLLNPGGILVTSSCSYNLSEQKFLEILRDCAADAGSAVRLLERRGQSADHPVLLSFPESSYLKCLILEKLA